MSIPIYLELLSPLWPLPNSKLAKLKLTDLGRSYLQLKIGGILELDLLFKTYFFFLGILKEGCVLLLECVYQISNDCFTFLGHLL